MPPDLGFFDLYQGGVLYSPAILGELTAHLFRAIYTAFGAAALLAWIVRVKT